MADLANLKIKVDSTDVKGASRDLGGLSVASKGAAKQTNLLGTAVKALSFVAAYAGISKVVSATIQFGDAMAEVSTLIDTTVVSMDDLTRAAREQAVAFGSTATEQANALYSIISAGATTATGAVSLLTEANKLAVGGVTDVATAADGLTTVVNAFGIASQDAGQVSDALFVGMRAGKTTIGELSRTLGLAAPLASEMGVSVDELVGSVAALTKGGIRTSIAVQGMRAVLAAVAKPTQEASETAEKLGLQFNSAALQSQGLAGFLDELREKSGGSQDELAKLFGGVEALVPIMALMGTAGKSFNEILEEMKAKGGAAAEAVEKMEQSLGFKTRQASASLTEVMLKLGDALSVVLIPALDWILKNGKIIQGVFSGLAVAVGLYAAKVAYAAIIQTKFAGIVVASIIKVMALTTAKFTLAGAATAATGAVKRLTLALIRNPFIAVSTALVALTTYMIGFRESTDEAIEGTRLLGDELVQLARLRSADFESKRNEAVRQQREAQADLFAAEKEIQELREQLDNTKIAPSIRQNIIRVREEKLGLQSLSQTSAELTTRIVEADAAFSEATRAAEEMAAIQNSVGGALSATTDDVDKQNQELERLQGILEGVQERLKQVNETQEQTEFRRLKEAAEEARALGAAGEELAINLSKAADAIQRQNKQQSLAARYEEIARAAKSAAQEFEQLMASTENANSTIGLTGVELEIANLGLEKTAFMARFAALGLEEAEEAWGKYYEAKQKGILEQAELEKDVQRIEDLRAGLEAVFDMLGRNGLGGVLSGVLRIQVRQDNGQFEQLGDILVKALGKLGETIVQAVQFAATGGLIGGAVGSRTGGSIGGAIGGFLGEEFLTKGLESVFKGLGKFAGPIGSIAGGLLGGIIGGMVASTPRASATVSTIAGGAMVSSVRGNKSQLRKMAEGLAGSVINGLQRIADELSGTIAEGINISIGVRKKTFRVDPLGLGRTKGMISFDTEEEAIRYAIKLALERGAIEGIRESTQRLLEAGDDLELALQNALDFEGVFDRLLEKTDPLAHELKELDKEFERLTRIFEQAGATTEEFADLQRLYDLEREEALQKERERQMDEQNKINDLILRIYREQGREAEELALTRRMERDAANEAERAILDQIYALEDFNQARLEEVETLEDTIRTMSQLGDSLRAFREGLFGADQSVMNYKQALVDLIRVGSLAATGDIEALGQLQGVSQTFLASSKANARSLFEYQRDVALVASYVDQGIEAADEQVSAAQQQIDLLDEQLQELVNISEILERVADPETPDVGVDPNWDAAIAGGPAGAPSGMFGENSADMEQLLRDALYSIARSTGQTANLLDRWDGDGQPDIRVLTSDYY